MIDPAFRIARLEKQLATLRWIVGLCVLCTGAAFVYAREAMNPDFIKIGRTQIHSGGISIASDGDDGHLQLRSDGVYLSDETGFTVLAGSRWSMEPNTRTTARPEYGVTFELGGTPTTNVAPTPAAAK